MTRLNMAVSSALRDPRPIPFVTTHVVSISDETADIQTIRMKRPEGFDFRAGQFLTLEIPTGGGRLVRSYPITSAPEAADHLEIAVKAEDAASRALQETVDVGRRLRVWPPEGSLVYPSAAEADGTPQSHRVLPFPTTAPAPPVAVEGVQEVVAFPRKEVAQQILRFARGEMMLHWAIAIPFMICFVTGMTVKLFYSLHSPGITRELLTFLHKVAGGCLAVFPILAILRNLRDYKVLIYNVKIGFTWTLDDLKWLFLVGPSTVSKKVVLPDQRKFNAAERLNFMMVMGTYPLFIVTGILLWIPGNHFVPWLVHVGMGLVAPLLMLGHIFMAVVNPDTRVGLSGMITGHVDRDWAKHHYAHWYRDHYHEDGTPKDAEWARQHA